MPFQTTASPVESNEEEEQDESPTGLVPMPPATIVRNVSRDEGSVVSELTGLSAEPSYYASAASSPARGGYRPTHAATHNHAGDNSPPVVPAATATSLLSSQYQQQSSTYGLLQASTSFDTGFDTALQPLPEEPSVQFSGTGSSTQVRVNHRNGEKQQQQGNGEEGQEIAVVAASTSPADDNDDDNDARCSIDFLLDDPSGMTLARRVALRLMQHQWYYKPRVLDGVSEALGASMIPYRSSSLGPSAAPLTAAASEAYPFSHSRRESPSLAKAWAYFEHVALPRHVLEPKDASIPKKNCLVRIIRKLFCKAGKELRRAEPGERELPTKLYEPLFTPHKQLGDFGLGIGLYFSTLRAMTVRGGALVCFVLFLLGRYRKGAFFIHSLTHRSPTFPNPNSLLRARRSLPCWQVCSTFPTFYTFLLRNIPMDNRKFPNCCKVQPFARTQCGSHVPIVVSIHKTTICPIHESGTHTILAIHPWCLPCTMHVTRHASSRGWSILRPLDWSCSESLL